MELRSTKPYARTFFVCGAAMTSIVRDATGELIVPVPATDLRSKIRLNLRRLSSRRCFETRFRPGTPALPVARTRYHWLPWLSGGRPAVSIVIQPDTLLFPSVPVGNVRFGKGVELGGAVVLLT